MSKFDMIVELMVKNGVTTKFSENLFKNLVNDELIIELDFSEHDKVFEDKIAKLEKDIASYKQAFEDKCSDYKFTSDLLEKFINENEESEQRIAELESKEDEKPTKCTTVIVAKEINGQTYVTLDDFMSVVNDLQAEIGT